MTSRVAVAPNVLRWALARSARSQRSLRAAFPSIDEWLTGERQPTMRQLESFSRATATPFGFLFLAAPPTESLPIPLYRTLGDQDVVQPSADLLETIQTMIRRQSWMRDYMVDEGLPMPSFVGAARTTDAPLPIAAAMREVLGLRQQWAGRLPTWSDALRTLRDSMDAAGILVAVNGIVGNNTRRVLNPQEFRGFVLVDEYAPLVFVNGTDAKAAQMFTLAHELAHVLKGSSAAFDLREMQPSADRIELACNSAAAEFLVPESEFHDEWAAARRDPAPFERLAFVFKVSALVAARRALDLGEITREEFIEFYERYSQQDLRRRMAAPDGGDFYANQGLRLGRRFSATVVRAAREGRLLYSEAYRLTGLHGSTFEQYAVRIEERES